MSRPRAVPLIRLGLTIVAGSVLASLVTYYVAAGQQMSDLQGPAPATAPRDLADHFVKNFLFAGAIPGILFYFGLAFMLLGIFRNVRRHPTHD